MTSPSHRIFVSHSHLDNDFGTRMAQDLRRILKDESAIFYDVLGGLHGGETWWEKILEELTARDVFLLVLSPDAMNSRWVNVEINIAWNKNKLILPVLHRSCTIRADLETIQIISFLAPKPYEAAFQEVLIALDLPLDIPMKPKEPPSQPGDPATRLIHQMEMAFVEHDWPDVIRKAKYLIKHMPESLSSTVYRWQGLALLEEGDVPQAQEALETALALVSDRELRLTLLGDYTGLLVRQGQWAKVLQQAKEALRLAPHDPAWLATQQQAQNQLAQQALRTSSPPKQEQTKDKEPSSVTLMSSPVSPSTPSPDAWQPRYYHWGWRRVRRGKDKKLHFPGQEADETVHIVVRRHWLFLVRPALPFIASVIGALLVPLGYATTPGAGSLWTFLELVMVILSFVTGGWFVYQEWAFWWLNIDIITSKRIINWHSGFTQPSRKETPLEKVQQVAIVQKSFWQFMFNYGDLHLYLTGGAIEIEKVPAPRKVKEAIWEASERFKAKKSPKEKPPKFPFPQKPRSSG